MGSTPRVVDWQNAITYLQDGQILNPIGRFSEILPLEGQRAPFMDAQGAIVGYRTFTEDGEPEHKRRRM